ncbi:MAG: 2-oxoglutarate and iron-dependent oxygenase domain-containing protein [Flavobacteriaceae bacterium]|jgi:isopenicillin N synthase-like dioxygenase|nr:2-oxoglutarate and iron-dependent oxygenase domain-containing protein [Flavobacteriaceae bacterium]
MNSIPSLNLQQFISGDLAQQQQFILDLGNAFEEIGFVAISGHYLDAALIDELYTQIKAFFDLPEDVKKKYEIEGLGGQRGYTSFGKEHAKGKKEGDLKEFWHFGQYAEVPEILKPHYPPNVIVEELPAFNEVGEKVFKALEKTAMALLRAISLHLGLKQHYFDAFVATGNSILRPIHYPPIQQAPKNAERAAAHGDINLITLLMGAHGRGLQVLNRKGDWIDAIAGENELMVNVGDMLSRHTNNVLKSTIHRVANPPKEMWGSSRYSIPFFMHPIATMPLNVLPHCINDQQPKQYADITAGDFLTERLIDLGLLKA